MTTPAPDLAIDRELVATLLREQHPDLSHLPLGRRFEGWDNVSVRLGGELLVRLPRRALAIELTRHEHLILPRVGPRLEIAVPVPIRTGEPSATFAAPWSVVRWIPGDPAVGATLDARQAARLGEALRRVHATPAQGLARNPHRGHPLSTRLEAVSAQLRTARAGGLLSEQTLARALEIWTSSAAAPAHAPSALIHGDLHPRNIVVRNGTIAGILDWGDTTPGDPAADLSVGWSLFEPPERAALWKAYGGVGPDALDRARGWALRFAALWLTDASDVEAFVIAGRRTIDRVVVDRRPITAHDQASGGSSAGSASAPKPSISPRP